MKNLSKVVSKSSLYLQVVNINSTLFGTPEILDHSFKLKIMSDSTVALFMKVLIRVVKTMSVNLSELLVK